MAFARRFGAGRSVRSGREAAAGIRSAEPMTRRESAGTPDESNDSGGAAAATSKPSARKGGDGGEAARAPQRRRPESFLAHRRGAAAAPPAPAETPEEPAPEFEPVTLGDDDEPGEPGKDRSPERAAQRARLQKELDAAPLTRHLGLRLDYADNGVSRVRLPAGDGDTDPGPLEGGVVGTACAAAGHFAAASLAPGVGIRLVEFKISLLGPIQGDMLAIGEVVRKGRTLVAARMEVVEDNDRVVAVALATYFLQHP